jgi:hypothetical protein
MVGAEHASEVRVGGAAAVVVGSDCRHDQRGLRAECGEAGDELPPLALIHARCEELLELIDDNDPA